MAESKTQAITNRRLDSKDARVVLQKVFQVNKVSILLHFGKLNSCTVGQLCPWNHIESERHFIAPFHLRRRRPAGERASVNKEVEKTVSCNLVLQKVDSI